MSGLVTQINQSGKTSGYIQGAGFYRFSDTVATWNIPACAMLVIECIGGGGGGGGGASQSSNDEGGAGGGGAALARMSFPRDGLGGSLTITVGSGGNAGSGGTNGHGTAGTGGGTSSVEDDSTGKIILAGYGGGGAGPSHDGGLNAGGGGGTGSAGETVSGY